MSVLVEPTSHAVVDDNVVGGEAGGSVDQSQAQSSSRRGRIWRSIEWAGIGTGAYLGESYAAIQGPGIVYNGCQWYFGGGIFSSFTSYSIVGTVAPYLGPVGAAVGGVVALASLKASSSIAKNGSSLAGKVYEFSVRYFNPENCVSVMGKSFSVFPEEAYIYLHGLERKEHQFFEAEDLLL